jgi:hypothetical protein
MKKDFIVSKIEASSDGSPYVYISISDPNDKSSEGSAHAGRNFIQSPFGIGIGAVQFTSPEDLMKNLPKAVSNMLGGYYNMQLKIGDNITIEIEKADSGTGV